MIKTECPRCNRMYQRIDVHMASCEKFPLPDEVRAYMIKNRPTVARMVRRWGVSQHFVEGYVQHFELSQYIGVWDKSKFQVQPAVGDSECIACEVKTFHSPPPSWGNVGVMIVGDRCEWCHEKGYEASRIKGTNAKFTDAQIREVRDMREAGKTYESISSHFGMSLSYVQKICNGGTRANAGGYIQSNGNRDYSSKKVQGRE